MNKKYKVAGIGEVLWDQLPLGDVLGGAPANVAYHAGQLGAESYIISAIGNDKLGNEIISRLSAKKINLLINRVAYPTGTVKVTLDDKGVPDFVITKDVAWDYIELTNDTISLAKQLDAVCSTPAPAAPRPNPQMGRRIISPEVQSDNRVTFRLYAPKSISVAIIGDWVSGAEARENPVRNNTGLWITTLGPLPPEFYGYTFLVDGVSVLDPSNPQIKRDGVRNASVLLVPARWSYMGQLAHLSF